MTKDLASKVTMTVVREYDAEGKLVGETVTTETKRFEPEVKRVVGFTNPVEIAK